MATCPSCSAPIDVPVKGGEMCLSCGAELPAMPPPIPGAARVKAAAAPPARPTIAAAPKALRRREPEPEPVRCPGCGSPSTHARCPGCGTLLRRD